jgi:hypothetical protein
VVVACIFLKNSSILIEGGGISINALFEFRADDLAGGSKASNLPLEDGLGGSAEARGEFSLKKVASCAALPKGDEGRGIMP